VWFTDTMTDNDTQATAHLFARLNDRVQQHYTGLGKVLHVTLTLYDHSTQELVDLHEWQCDYGDDEAHDTLWQTAHAAVAVYQVDWADAQYFNFDGVNLVGWPLGATWQTITDPLATIAADWASRQ